MTSSEPALSKLRELHQRLGRDALLKILRTFYATMASDILVGYFFDHKNPDAIAEMQLAFMEKAMGLSAVYQGRTPPNAHLELPPILSGHFDRRIQILRETLKAASLTAPQIEAWISFEALFRDVVISRDET